MRTAANLATAARLLAVCQLLRQTLTQLALLLHRQ
jgi:hypothetical protein